MNEANYYRFIGHLIVFILGAGAVGGAIFGTTGIILGSIAGSVFCFLTEDKIKWKL